MCFITERISESMNEEGSMPVFDDDLLEVLEDKHLLVDSNNLFIGEELGRGILFSLTISRLHSSIQTNE